MDRRTDGERDRLAAVYQGFGDEELRALEAKRDELTEAGQEALAAELKARKLPRVDTLADANGDGQGTTLRADATLKHEIAEGSDTEGGDGGGLVTLVKFWDGLELGKACGWLEQDGVAFTIVPKEAAEGAPGHFELRVRREERSVGEQVLRRTMNLFPLAEHEIPTEVAEDGELATLGSFETREEAAEVVSLLAVADVEGYLTEPEGTEPGDDWFAVQVREADLDRGLRVVAEQLGLENAS